MLPRPHLAFRGRFDLGTSLGIAGLAKGDGARLSPGAGRPPDGDTTAFGPGAPRGRMRLSAIVAGEVVVVLALAVVVVRGTADPARSSWTLLAALLAMLVLSYLRRRSFPAEPAD